MISDKIKITVIFFPYDGQTLTELQCFLIVAFELAFVKT